MTAIQRELIYIWYYFQVQLEQIAGWWVLGMTAGSAVSVFARDRIHRIFQSLHGRKMGVLGIPAASILGIAVAIVYVRDNSYCGIFFQKRDPGQLAGRIYDVLNPAEPPADPLQRGAGRKSSDRPDRILLSLREFGRADHSFFLQEQGVLFL